MALIERELTRCAYIDLTMGFIGRCGEMCAWAVLESVGGQFAFELGR